MFIPFTDYKHMLSSSTLLIGATHGNEPIGVEACLELQNDIPSLNWTIGSPKAFQQRTREYEGDLNRSAPGSLDSSRYAERRAAEIIGLSKNFKRVIDIHGTVQATGIFVIVSRLSKENLKLAAMLPIQRIVIWQSSSNRQPLNVCVSCGIEIECGSQDDPSVRKELYSVLKDFLMRSEEMPDNECEQVLKSKEIFEVYGTQTSTPDGFKLAEFQEVQVLNQRFFPLLINVYSVSGIACYKMRRKSYSLNPLI